MEKKEYKLIQSYLLEKYFISTAYRRASMPGNIWYYETIVWEWDKETKKRGKMLLQEDSGTGVMKAHYNHNKIIENLLIED